MSVDARGEASPPARLDRDDRHPTAAAVVESLLADGVREFVYTDVDRDGMLEGPDLEGVRELGSSLAGELIYSGGIGRIEDLEGLAGLRLASLDRGDRRQGSLRAPLHDRPGEGGARGLALGMHSSG